MSLRNRMLLAVIGSMTLVVGLLTLNLYYDSFRRVQADRAKMGELLRRVVQDWLLQNERLIHDPNDPQGWSDLSDRLSRSTLFREWYIVNDIRQPVAGNISLPSPDRILQDDAIRAALEEGGPPILNGNELTAPLLVGSDARRMAIRLSVEHLPLTETAMVDSFRTVLAVMALGTVLIILNVYVLLRGIVLRPLEKLAEASRRVAQGDYTQRLPEPARYDEIAQLIQSYNLMMDRIAESHHSLERRVEEATEQVRTTQKQLAVAQRLSAMGTLAAGIAHEINNPLGGLLNAARTLRKEAPADTKQRQYLDLVTEGLERIQGTVRQILQFSPRQLHPQPVAPAEVIEHALALVRHKAGQKRVTIENRLSPSLPPVFGDAPELQQVFLNLLMNAIDAVAEGMGRVIVTGEVAGKDEVIVIADNGVGMTEEEMSKAFDLFFTTKDVGEGSGLGLAVVHTIVENHGGEVTLQSSKGQGTRAVVRLPILPPGGRPADGRPPALPLGTFRG